MCELGKGLVGSPRGGAKGFHLCALEESQAVASPQASSQPGAGGSGRAPPAPPHVPALLLAALNLLLKDPVPAVRMKVAETLGRLVRIL